MNTNNFQSILNDSQQEFEQLFESKKNFNTDNAYFWLISQNLDLGLFYGTLDIIFIPEILEPALHNIRKSFKNSHNLEKNLEKNLNIGINFIINIGPGLNNVVNYLDIENNYEFYKENHPRIIEEYLIVHEKVSKYKGKIILDHKI